MMKNQETADYGVGLIEEALKEGRTVLSEHESKQLFSHYRIPVTREKLVYDIEGLDSAIQEIGFPIALKGCSFEITHKTEEGLISLDLRNEEETFLAFKNIKKKVEKYKGAILVQEMVKGQRELIVGFVRDAQFGPCVMFGLGGVLGEAINDVSFRIAPLNKTDALKMIGEIKGYKILDEIRGMQATDKDTLADVLIRIGQIGLENTNIKEIDINPLIIVKSKPVAVDGLVVLREQ